MLLLLLLEPIIIIIIIIIIIVLIKVTLSCIKHYRGTVQKITKRRQAVAGLVTKGRPEQYSV